MARFVVLSLVLVLCSVLTVAQTSPVGIPVNSATIPIPLGFIDPLSTQVHLEIPIASVPQRNAPPATATLVFDPIVCTPSPTWSCGYKTGWQLQMIPLSPTYLAMGTFGYSVWTDSNCPDQAYPYGGQAHVYNIRFSDLHGTVHATGSGSTTPQLTWIACHDAQGHQDPNTGTLHQWAGLSSDGAGYFFNVSYDSTGNLLSEVWAVDGTVVANLLSVSYGYVGTTNGNNFFGQFAQSPLTQDGAYCPTHVYAKASDGSNQTYTINCQNYSVSSGTSTTTESFVSSLVLPDGTQYSFSYDTGTSGTHLGALTGVTLPTGGQLQLGYTYSPTTCYCLTSATFDGGTWQFARVLNSNQTQTTATVTGPSRYDSVSKSYVNDKTVYTSVLGSLPPHIQTIQRYSGPSTLLETLSFGYQFAYGGGCVSSVTTTLNDTGQSSQIQYQYVTPMIACSLVTQKQEFDFGASSPTRTTKISYQGDTSSIHYNSLYHIYNLPTSVSVYAGSGTGSPISSTTYTYDEYGASYCKNFNGNPVPMLTNIAGATNHDDAGHGSLFWARGNVTSISKLVSGSTYVTSHVCYDTLGNVTQQIDEASNPTNFDYTENWADTSCIASGTLTRAFPTTITDAIGHRVKTTRYTCTGLSSAVADENDLDASPVRSGTTSTYDWANRPLCTNYPDGGQTCNSYFMTANPPYSTQSVLMSSTTSIGTKAVLDGYGRTTQTQLTTDPAGIDYTDTTYDAFGRTASVSNPYRTVQDSTYGVAYSYFDALGRPTSVVETDGSATATSYSGNTTTATDESGKKRKSQTDALGRLTFVWEDPSGLNLETDYAYDMLDNLTSVTQKGGASSSSWRVRTYTYDALSRIVCAANPEIQPVTCPASATGTIPTGAVAYTYDNVGNVTTKTAPAPNQARTGTATVTTTYTYDTLNRLTGVSYNDAYNGNMTPGVTYGYDEVNLSCPTPIGFVGSSYATNGMGRRTAMCYSMGNKSWAYDPMGRIQGENERFIGLVTPYNSSIVFNINGVQTISANTAYAYYLNGDLQGDSSPAWYEFYTDENGAGQITSVGDEFYNVLTGTTYAPTGQLATALVGATGSYNGNTITNTYNKRLQPVQLSAATASGASILSLAYNFNFGNGTTGSDNGNVIQIANGKDSNRTQNFLYDSLNRIQQAYTNGSNWGETYSPFATAPGVPPTSAGIDAWGNLTNRSGVTGKTNSENALNCAPANTSNQLNTCFTYDGAGNLIQNGSTKYVYDAENRLIAAGGMSYVYDGDGNRIKKCTEANNSPGICATNAAGTFYWLHENGGTLAESDLGGNFTAAYDRITGQIAARIDLPAKVVHYYFHDHLGSAGVVTDASGNILKESDYYPYGGEIAISGSDSNKYKFTGQERDSESGLDYFGARHYSSALGRFMVPDPLGAYAASPNSPQSWNLYAYVLNNPLAATDPLGLFCVWDNGSFDSADDPGTGSFDKCQGLNGAGGTWIEGNPGDVVDSNGNQVFGSADWSGAANPEGAALAQMFNPNGTGDFGVPSGTADASVSGNFSTVATITSSLPGQISGGCGVSALSLNGYLGTKISPMVGQGTNLMNTGQKYNLDPRLLVSIAGAETSFGRNITAGQFNAFNVLYNGLNSPFASWQAAINSVGHSLTNKKNGYNLANTTTMYQTYCTTGSTCGAGLRNINTFMAQQGANVSALHFPCP